MADAEKITVTNFQIKSLADTVQVFAEQIRRSSGANQINISEQVKTNVRQYLDFITKEIEGIKQVNLVCANKEDRYAVVDFVSQTQIDAMVNITLRKTVLGLRALWKEVCYSESARNESDLAYTDRQNMIGICEDIVAGVDRIETDPSKQLFMPEPAQAPIVIK